MDANDSCLHNDSTAASAMGGTFFIFLVINCGGKWMMMLKGLDA